MIIVSTISFNKSLFNIISNYIRLNSNTHVCCFIQIDLEKYTKGVEDKQLNLAKVVFVLPISRHFTLCVLMRKSLLTNEILIDDAMTEQIIDQGLLIR